MIFMGVQDILPQNMAPKNSEYFKLKAFEKARKETHGCFISMYDKIHYNVKKKKKREKARKAGRLCDPPQTITFLYRCLLVLILGYVLVAQSCLTR